MFTFLRIERPTTQTLRPTSTATSIACCMRWTFEANDATRMRPVAQRDDLPEGLADEPLRAGHARPLGVRRVAEQEVDAAVADLREAADVGAAGRPPACGRSCSRRCARCARPGSRARSRPSPGSSAPCGRTRPGTGPSSTRLVVRIGLAQLGGAQQAVLVELRLDQPERQPRRPDLLDADLAQQVRKRADVILVAVRQQDGADRRLPRSARYEKSGRIRSTPRCSSRGNASPASTTSMASRRPRYDGHVLADLTEAAERDDSGTSGHRGSLDAAQASLRPRRTR